MGEALLIEHVSYLKPLDGLLDSGMIKGLVHITGGGLIDNIPRILPEACAVEIDKDSWPVLPIYELMQQIGNVSEAEMYRTFNMGVGMVVVCAPGNQKVIASHLSSKDTACFEIGRVVQGERDVRLL